MSRRTNSSSPDSDLPRRILEHFQTLRVPLSAAELDAAVARGDAAAVDVERCVGQDLVGRAHGDQGTVGDQHVGYPPSKQYSELGKERIIGLSRHPDIQSFLETLDVYVW